MHCFNFGKAFVIVSVHIQEMLWLAVRIRVVRRHVRYNIHS